MLMSLCSCHYAHVIMPSVVMLNVTYMSYMLSVSMLNVDMRSIIILSVVMLRNFGVNLLQKLHLEIIFTTTKWPSLQKV